MSLSFERFQYETKGSFKGLDMLGLYLGLAKGYSTLEPIADGSVPIKSLNGANFSTSKESGQVNKIMSEILQCGTKPLDAIAYVATLMQSPESEYRSFKFEVGEAKEQNQFDAIALMAASVVVFVSRGAFPSRDESRGNTPLPKFVKDIVKQLNLQTERELGLALSSYDTRHVEVHHFFNEESLKGWDLIMANRLNLGVAGHKPLKVVKELEGKILLDGNSKAVEYLKTLLNMHAAMKDGFYPNLHPSNQTFSSKYKGFYHQSLAAIYDVLKGSQAERLAVLLSSDALKNEDILKPDQNGQVKVVTISRGYQHWNYEEMTHDLGKVAKFLPGKEKAGKAMEVVGKPVVFGKKDDSKKASGKEITIE